MEKANVPLSSQERARVRFLLATSSAFQVPSPAKEKGKCYNKIMIAHITGTLIKKTERGLVIDVGGIGYIVYTSKEVRENTRLGKETSLSTHMVVREDALDLYGFTEEYEKEVFELLIGISGVGPKSAIGILDVIDAETLIRAISTQDVKALINISGIGKKTAEKIVLELKDKLISHGKYDARSLEDESDALLALISLGYQQNEVRKILREIPDHLATSTKIKEALKILGSRNS